MIYLTHVSPPLRHTHLPLRRLQSNPVRPALSFFFNGFLGFELESMASSSSSDRQNQEFNAFSGIEPACKRRKVDESSTLFDVFINHRGPDVKQTLATQLHNSLAQLAIRAFLDSQEKELGNSFPSTIETAIRSAKVHIAIFSRRYAESPWCLAELVLMLKSNAKIIPVFYEVEPWELRHIEKGGYNEAFVKYEEKGRYLEKLSEWKEALQYLSFTAGEEVYSDRDCQKIVEAVQKEVHRKTCLHVAEYPVGLNNLVKDFERRSLNKLVQDFEDHCGLEERKHKAKVVGIFGMGGSGKTTLAKELFNQKKSNYNRASFLFDVREASVRSELPSLQGQLLKDLFSENHLSFRSTEEGTSYLTDRLQRNRHLSFLIVVDDIDHVEQLNALRVMDVLNKSDNSLVIVTTRDVGVLITGGITYGYNLKGMDRNDAQELFCWHAFRQTHPCSGYEELVDDFLEVCGGLPLSLQVLGRHLHHRAPSYWSLQLIKAKKMLPRDVKQRLKISFDALDDEEKQVFMDIACFFLGKPKCIAERVCEGSGWNTQLALETLKDKCLVEEKENFSVLYNRGEIVLRMHDHLRDLGREMASEISSPRRLWRPQDLKSLELMGLKTILSQTNVRCFHSIFDKFMGSQVTFFLGQSDICFETSACLLWLQLEGTSTEQPSIPSWIPLQNLQCLKIKGGRLKTLWTNHIQAPSNLKELLILQTSLKEFPDLLGISDDLENVFLDAQGLPIQGLSLLESFNMNLCSLRLWFSTLNGEATSAKRGKTLCKSLVIQNFKFNGEMDWNERGISCSVKAPMGALKKLEISGEIFLSKILISGIHYPSLESIKLDRVQNLLEVNLTGVKTLNCLAITHCGKVKRLAASDLRNLMLLTISHCPEFEELSNHDLSTRLCISMCPKLEELPSLSRVSCMEEFEIKHCEKIQNIMLPTTLMSLSVQGCRDLQRVAGTGDLTKLAKLYISDCPKLEKLLDLAMSCLEEIEIKHCEKIQNIMLPTTLMSLSVQGCRGLQRVAGTGDLTKLAKLDINECPQLEELPSLSRVSCLEEIEIKHCEKIQNIMLPTTLISPSLQGCLNRDLQGVDRTGDLTKLAKLYISDCPKLEKLLDFATSCLQEFEIKHCEKIQNIMLPTTLMSLSVQGCRDLQRVAGTGDLTKLAKLYISDCPKLEKLLDLAMSCLQEIEIKHCEKIQIIMLPTTLMSLSVQGCKDLQRVAGTGDLTKLAKLYINECPELEELPSLSRGSCLKQLVIDSCEKLQNRSGIEELHVSHAMRLCYCGNAVIRNCIHELKTMPQCGMEMIGRAVDGAESTLNRHLFSDANIAVDAVTDIGTQKTYVKWSKLSAVIGCFVVVVKSSNVVTVVNEINEVSNSRVCSDRELKVDKGEWIITTVACDNFRYRGLKKILDVYRRYGVMKKGCWIKVQKGEEGKSIGVLCTIVDRLHHS